MYQAGLAVLCISVTPETSAAGVHPRRPGTSARPGEGAGRGKPSPGLPGQAPARLPGRSTRRLPARGPARLPGRSTPHPTDIAAKLEAFAVLNTLTAVFVQNELAGGAAAQRRNAAYLEHAVTSGEHPRLAWLLAGADATTADPGDRYADILTRVLTGLLGPPLRT